MLPPSGNRNHLRWPRKRRKLIVHTKHEGNLCVCVWCMLECCILSNSKSSLSDYLLIALGSARKQEIVRDGMGGKT